mmetsp:Transcript_82295/g.180972  ORF Transcript_82295/g.180972 Transcript_82295/m.180972 type:complete len:675 (-) Transcript_82295:205-2229(-)|eukprot:CAMPEP_0206530720 /NCGR_PEP_ID=MMETSP0325_2-20121206/3337_1 /ASSEMBLY_ACC=CAM_ASM_000347 /TAXON_ID=2866 /ORGANISM="Crypthecodinium cohnii, Strain Seligo" /LENGTH=674 /DNA_ID=CAMNT_0054026825 /DNA_START=178 /DNA_END=2202 /DNA_ORIENTATION=-
MVSTTTSLSLALAIGCLSTCLAVRILGFLAILLQRLETVLQSMIFMLFVLASGAIGLAFLQALRKGTLLNCFHDDGWARVLAYWKKVMPPATHYKFVEITTKYKSEEERAKAYAKLHKQYAHYSAEVCQELEGFYIKIGQMVAGAGTGVMPEEYIRELSVLLEDCKPIPIDIVKQTIAKELGPYEEIFEHFEEEPLNCASIGQVHAARLHGGMEVVVKVQRPDAERQFRVDLGCFIQTGKWLFPEHLDELHEIDVAFASEFDYRVEATQQREAAGYLAKIKNIVVPLPIDGQHEEGRVIVEQLRKTSSTGKSRTLEHGLCTKRILVMERLYGKSLAKWGDEVFATLAKEKGISREQALLNLQDMKPEDYEAQAINETALWMYSATSEATETVAGVARSAYEITAPIRDTLGFGVHSVTASVFDWIVSPFTGSDDWEEEAKMATSQPTLPAPKKEPQTIMDLATPALCRHLLRLPEAIFEAQGHLLFNCGFIHTDPHPGNIMFLDDGRLGMIDWGQVKRLNERQRVLLARAVIAVADEDEVLAAQCMRDMGMKTKQDLDWTYSRQAWHFLASWLDPRIVEMGGPCQVDELLGKVDKVVHGIGELWMPMRGQFFTRQGLAMLGYPKINSSKMLKGAAVDFLKSRKEPIPNTKQSTVPTPAKVRPYLVPVKTGGSSN